MDGWARGLGEPSGESADELLRERLRRTEAVTDVGLSQLTMDNLLDELLSRLRELLDTDTAAVLLLDDSRQFLTPIIAQGLEEEVTQGVRIPVGRGFAGRVAAEARAVVLSEVTARNVINPILLRKNVRTMLGVPLWDAEQVIGVLHVGSLRPREFTDGDAALLQLVGERVAGAIVNNRAYIDREAAATLQRSLAPRRLPTMAGYELAARYVPSSRHGVSGDWYDAFTLPGGRLGIVIGDVMGHGLRAATVMGRVKSALRAYALDWDDPAIAIRHLDRKLQHFEPGHLTTLVYAVLEPATGEVVFSSAGHLPVAVRAPDGTTTLIQPVTGLPIGVDLGPPRDTVRLTLEPGALLCLYTDGLIDHRTADLDDGLATLAATLTDPTTGGDSPESACLALMSALVGERHVDDDVTILCIRRDDARAVNDR